MRWRTTGVVTHPRPAWLQLGSKRPAWLVSATEAPPQKIASKKDLCVATRSKRNGDRTGRGTETGQGVPRDGDIDNTQTDTLSPR